MMSQDADAAGAANTRRELTDEISDGLYGSATQLPTVVTPTAQLQINAELRDNSTGLELQLTNQEQLVETDRVLKPIEVKHKTLKNGILKISPSPASGDVTIIDLPTLGYSELAPGQTITVPLGDKLQPDQISQISIAQRIANIPYGAQIIYQQTN